MTASPKKRGAKSLSFWREEPRQRKAGRRKLNVFARWGRTKFYSRSHAMMVSMFDESGALIETNESEDVFREP